MLGKWIDTLPDVPRDRIIEATDWAKGAMLWEDGRRCLLGHVGNARVGKNSTVSAEAIIFPVFEQFWPDWVFSNHSYAIRFDRLASRFGLARIVHACKQRAAKQTNAAVTYWLTDGDTPVEQVPKPQPSAAVMHALRTPVLPVDALWHRLMEDLQKLGPGTKFAVNGEPQDWRGWFDV